MIDDKKEEFVRNYAPGMLAKIQEKRAEVGEAKTLWDRLKEKAKQAKEAWEVEVAELDRLILDSEETPIEAYVRGQKAKEQGDDAWKVELIEDALPSVPAAIRAKLEQAELRNLGDLQQYLDKCQLTDIKGVGEEGTANDRSGEDG